ncbi:MAG TPA: NADH-quinone oxidoreductase subunit G [Actinomycetota bacterium]|nr:NADH-quinone oxidoreductase subunit G [Actinomycetota bacterium]
MERRGRRRSDCERSEAERTGATRRPAVTNVSLTIDGKEVTVPQGTLIIRAAERLGIEIPRFCDHPFLEPVGACRQCYVEVEGQRKLFTSCTTTVAPGMEVRTQYTSDVVRDAQEANLEFLLLNHPLDCPVCDRGGECPLQDQALAFGPGESRYTEPKRVYAKPIPLSPLVKLDRERCVLCARCTRFCDEISGDRFIELFARGAGERVSISAGEDFRSPFSGNTVQICPVGALTSSTYRFVARPFDLTSADSVCGHCSAGCNVKVDVRRAELVRVLARDNLEVNDAWLCDKGRYAFRHPDLPTRITTPLIRDRGLEPASYGEVLGTVASWCHDARVAFLASGRLADEDAYALSKLARTVVGTNDLDHRRIFGGGKAEELAAATSLATTYRDVERAKVIVLAGLDAEQEVPILHLRIRKAARRGARVFVIHPRLTRLHDVAEHELCRPEHQTYVLEQIHDASVEGEAEGFPERVARALRDAGGDGVVLAGERLAEHPLAADVALSVAQRFGARFGYVTRRANDRGALRAGVHPALLPGGRRVDDADRRAEVEAAWGSLPTGRPGRNARQILSACAAGEIDVLYLIGVDPIRDLPDAGLARRALGNVRFKVVQGLELGELEPYADAYLPAAAWAEREGSTTDWEGRSQAIRPVRPPAGVSRPDWEIFAALAAAMGGDLGFDTIEELREEATPLLEPRPALVRTDAWTGTGRPQLLGDLTMFSYPLLVDDGRLSQGADELKAALSPEPFAEVHPEDAEKRGIVDGGRIRVRTGLGDAEVPVRVTPAVAAGSVFVPFNQPGLAANRLLARGFVEPATIERVDTPEGSADAVEGGA